MGSVGTARAVRDDVVDRQALSGMKPTSRGPAFDAPHSQRSARRGRSLARSTRAAGEPSRGPAIGSADASPATRSKRVLAGTVEISVGAQLATIAEMLNERPRKTLAWRSPAEAYAELLAVQ